VVVHPDDRPLLAFQLEDKSEVYLDRRFAFGVSSAAYWWGRLGAAGVRVVHYVLGAPLASWVLLYADDWLIVPTTEARAESVLVALWALSVLGFPVKWAKCSGGPVLDWVGLELCFESSSLGISARRATWAIGWMEKVLVDNMVLIKELLAALGRLVFAFGALEHDRAFLAPLFTFAALHPAGGVVPLPLFVRMTLSWLVRRLRGRRLQPCAEELETHGDFLRVDA
jgi:hypothetical protein